jgi:hypothetical protein
VKTIRFNQTVVRRRHGTEQVFEEGVKYPLSDDIADHYLKRGQAQEVTGKTNKASTSENANADTVGGSADVGGKDGGGAGGRVEPDAKPAAGGKGGGRGKGKGARGK